MSDCRGQLLGLDCSEEKQAERRREIDALKAKLRTGISSLADRGRSAAYQSPAILKQLIAQLQGEIEACTLGRWRRKRRLAVIDYNKGL